MVFFDDEMRNIADAKSLGIEAVLVENGISFEKVIYQVFNTSENQRK
jgi:FMN phosphatase YigB (HAD superfamily)